MNKMFTEERGPAQRLSQLPFSASINFELFLSRQTSLNNTTTNLNS